MSDEKDFHDEAEAIRAETAADAPELAEHDLVSELQQKLEEANGKALYAAAELQNSRRRMEKEMADTRAYAVTGFARDMLAVRDHLDRALGHVPAEARTDEKSKSFIEGIEATLRELDSILTRNGVTKVESVGHPLDPHKHQAMIEIATDSAEPGTIVEEMQSGYMIKDRLLRPALVGVAKAG
ncbi:nucleotide exchange factor GrpE [Sphingomonas jaspsi]|uniref:nucleotide exchange factor GrpE n=1 Tax=Sphingomonas jaspsi TaxID=392409 RepID=UPI0004BB4CCD|nr:nucleotide exchange factor GrpE [Sphingomonas jaspsi]